MSSVYRTGTIVSAMEAGMREAPATGAAERKSLTRRALGELTRRAGGRCPAGQGGGME